MEEFFVYLLKSSGILILFWVAFKVFLQQETFFTFHRIFLILGLLMALLFPLWTLTRVITIEALPYVFMESPVPNNVASVTNPQYTGWHLAGFIYLLGVFFFLGRLVLQLASLHRLLKGGITINRTRFTYVETQEDTSPFSFFRYIVFNPTLHSPTELETILTHEKIHAQQGHSFDTVLLHLFAAFQWINPFVWWYKGTYLQNLEYIADQEVAKNTAGHKEYQYLLLKNSGVAIPRSSIINPIFNSSIKKRIVMLNKNRSHYLKAWKFSLVIPFLAFFLVAFNTKTVTQIKLPDETQNPTTSNGNSTKLVYTIDKTTTDETLKRISASLKKECDMDLLFKDVTRNAEGFITNINSSYTVKDGSGTSSTSDVDGIKPFTISVIRDADGNLISVGFQMNPTEPSNTGIGKSPQVRSGASDNPVYIIDGVEYKPGTEPELNPANINRIDVIKGPTAIEKYGDKGKNGVINVITIKKSDAKGINDALELLIPGQDSSAEKTAPSITVTGYRTSDSINNIQPNFGEKTPTTVTITGYKASNLSGNPLIMVDGVEKEPGFNLSTIPADSIDNIKVLKDGEATLQFGEKGANGVVDITTKKSGWAVGYGVNMDNPNDLFDISPFRQKELEKAIIFVDGVNMGENYVPTMKYSEVESIGTYPPGKFTTDKFGRQGKNGVIEITTKKN